ncbi:MAG: type II toxin-antitoxin system VapC family toxin [Thermodesulfobacteriota bacterium]
MSGKYLLDTNIIIALFAGDAGVRERIARIGEVFTSSTVMGELYYGAQKSGLAKKNLARLDKLAASSTILSCDLDTARQYGLLKNQLLQQGRPIPENDIWIAASARQHDLILVTRDIHFQEVKGLIIEMW